MKRIILVILLLILVSSCATRRGVITTDKEVKYDSIFIENTKIVRDTVLVSPKAKVRFKQDLNSLQKVFKTPLIKRSNQAKIKLQVIRDTLYVDAECDTLQFKAKLFESIQKESKVALQTKEVVKEVPKKYVPKITQYFARFGMVCLGILIGLIGLRLFKIKIPFL